MTGTELEALLRRIGWSVGELARRLGIRPGSVNQWLNGRRPIPDNVIEWLELVAQGVDSAPALPRGWTTDDGAGSAS